ncbi:sugar ABC transporter ATP-binding protein [bacterium]|nr:sugar ABC transporter ATP-binding protein [bacterium]
MAYLVMRGITKQFPGVLALDNVNFEVERGEIHALVGENGAGKSTLLKILAGALPMDKGEIILDGKPVVFHSPLDAMRHGIAVIYQEFNLVPYLSAGENIFLGREPRKFNGFVDFKKLHAEAQAILNRIGANFSSRDIVARLSVAQQQMTEIAKALSQNAKIIAMDEPTSALTEKEVEHLFEIMRGLKEEGVAIIFVSHRLEEIFQIAERITVLRDGKYVGTKRVEETNRDEVITMMVGREIKEKIPKRPAKIGDEILRVEGLTRKGVFSDITFSLRKGEILGLAGLVGSGRTEIARAIFGADPIDSGKIYLEGKEVKIRSPQDAIRLGIGLLTEDRKRYGLILPMTVRENTTLANLMEVAMRGFINFSRERAVAKRFVDELAIKTPSVEQLARNLSGGTQQKLVLAKWLFTKSKVLIFDEPTRGIDVGAKVEIYELMNQLAERGVGIIMISSELPEVLGMSDRILVIHEGKIAGELMREEATQEKIMQLATGGSIADR